jgi:hypothetical protein
LTSSQGVDTSVVLGGGGAWRHLAASAAWSWRLVCRRLGGLETASNIEGCGWAFLVLEAAVLVCVSENAERLCRRPHGLTDAIGCGGRQFPTSGRRGLNRRRLASPIQHTPPVFVYFRRLLDVFTERLHGYERKLAKGGELKRVRAPACRNAWRRRLRHC